MRNLVLSCLLLWVFPVFGEEIIVNFRDSTLEQAPTNFDSVLVGAGQPGKWTVLSDQVTPLLTPLTDRAPSVSTRPVLAQTSPDPTDERFPILLYQREIFRDFKLSTRFKIVGGSAEQMAGMVFHFQNTSNFYVIRASALGHNVRFYSVINGLRSTPVGPQVDVSLGVWHTLVIECSGPKITFWYDNNPGLVLNDPTFSTGKIGFWTKSDSVSYFSDLTIDYTPIVPAAQTIVADLVRKETKLLGLRVYALDSHGQTHVIASKDPAEVGQAGGTAEKAAITDGTVSVGHGPGTVAIWLPLRDRNGDPMAAAWVRLKSFAGETQETAITRATMIIKQLQEQMTSSDDLAK